MKNFIFKSNDTSDLQKMFQSFETKLDIINQNILYITHRIDTVNTIVHELITDKSLQKQVDEYFEEDTEHIPEEDKEPD